MNKKAQMVGLGVFFTLFIGIIAALALYQGILPLIGESTLSASTVNASFSMPASGARVDLTGQEILNTPIVINGTGGNETIPASNYTIDEIVSETTGVKTISYLAKDGHFEDEGTIRVT